MTFRKVGSQGRVGQKHVCPYPCTSLHLYIMTQPKLIVSKCFYLSWALCIHPRHPVLHFEWVNVPGHVDTNDETSSPPLCWSCSLISNMHLPNYYETGWINLLDIESSPSKYWPVSIYQVGLISVCNVYQKIVILMIPYTNF